MTAESAAPTPSAPTRRPQRINRRSARELAVQGLYEWLLTGQSAAAIQQHVMGWTEEAPAAKVDTVHLDALISGCIAEAAVLDEHIARHIDRGVKELSPVEHAILLIGAYEMAHCIDIPVKVVINEAVELAKAFGGTDGHKYVNGVLDKIAGTLRAVEVAHLRGARPARD
ncbi:transcription antitermination factor NusB [Amphibiibacter pelophylacis]|uniref:Transcription antitermination factor NusB n=1 Tax=Amphibiibacter pelophylacis TaxID=1799477 RepID=A0ACC6NZ32_9BURK